MVLGKLVPRRLLIWITLSRARAYCACSRCGWLFGHFSLVCLFVKSKTTNQPNPVVSSMRTPVYSYYHIYSKVSDKMRVVVKTVIDCSFYDSGFKFTLCCCMKFAEQLSRW